MSDAVIAVKRHFDDQGHLRYATAAMSEQFSDDPSLVRVMLRDVGARLIELGTDEVGHYAMCEHRYLRMAARRIRDKFVFPDAVRVSGRIERFRFGAFSGYADPGLPTRRGERADAVFWFGTGRPSARMVDRTLHVYDANPHDPLESLAHIEGARP